MLIRFVLSSVALLAAASLISVSLLAYSSKVVAREDVPPLTQRRLYAGQVLPDHILYPVVAGIDRVRLERTQGAQRVLTKVEYSHRRLFYGQELLNSGQSGLAINTLHKAFQYLLAASDTVLDQPVADSTLNLIDRSWRYQIEQLSRAKQQHPALSTQLDELSNQYQAEYQAFLDSIELM